MTIPPVSSPLKLDSNLLGMWQITHTHQICLYFQTVMVCPCTIHALCNLLDDRPRRSLGTASPAGPDAAEEVLGVLERHWACRGSRGLLSDLWIWSGPWSAQMNFRIVLLAPRRNSGPSQRQKRYWGGGRAPRLRLCSRDLSYANINTRGWYLEAETTLNYPLILGVKEAP